MITDYKEGGIKNPEVMQQRGVFTRKDLTTQWYNASKKFGWGGQEYRYNLAGALKEIKNQIDKYKDPVVLRIAGSYEHFVTVYGYKNSCTFASDVLIKDPYNKTQTLQEAFKTWPTFVYLKRII